MKEKKYFAHETAIIESNAKIGDNTRIWHFAHVREGSTIGSNCTVGKDCFIDTSVVIGNGVKIQNGVSIYKGVSIEDDVFIGPNVTFTNDPYPRAFSKNWNIRQTHIKKGASIGANATLVCGINIGNYSMIAAGSVVTKNVHDFCIIAGNPAKIQGFVCICGSKLNEFERKCDSAVFKCNSCNSEISIPIAIVDSAHQRKHDE
ncbi:MAG: N-acetyltransferase [Deltaproteobacteria bacterium]|nr:N-acetyltransferase [Deltaproteobacteria bacterium]